MIKEGDIEKFKSLGEISFSKFFLMLKTQSPDWLKQRSSENGETKQQSIDNLFYSVYFWFVLNIKRIYSSIQLLRIIVEVDIFDLFWFLKPFE